MPSSRYEILNFVNQGQSGRVFCARDRYNGHIVALKELAHNRCPTQRFLRELRFLATFNHPNIVAYRALEHTDTGRYLVMDYCDAGTLRDLIEREKTLKFSESLALILKILSGLDYVHHRGVVHRDIKPENILLTTHPQLRWVPQLSDFGIACSQQELTGSYGSNTMGALAYTAPESFYGLYSKTSDLYSMGVLLFELLLGYRPFEGIPTTLAWAHLNQRVLLPAALPQPLAAVIQKSLEKLPARRYRSAACMAKAIQQAKAQVLQ